MTQETQNKFAAIAAAQLAKATKKTEAGKEAIKPKVRIMTQPAPQPQPKRQETPPQVTASPMPELSTFSFDDLMNEKQPEFCAPMAFTMPVLKQQPEVQVLPAFKIIDYSDRSFAIVTPEKPTEEVLNIFRLHGSFNANLKCGKGWIFSKRHLQSVKDKLAALK